MLFTSVGFSADLHYCKGELKTFSLFGEAKSCHTAKKSCPHHANMLVTEKSEKDCCTNKTIEVDDLDADFNVSSDLVKTDLQVKWVTIFVYSFFSKAPLKEVKFSFLDSNDQIPPVDIYVLLERFLI